MPSSWPRINHARRSVPSRPCGRPTPRPSRAGVPVARGGTFQPRPMTGRTARGRGPARRPARTTCGRSRWPKVSMATTVPSWERADEPMAAMPLSQLRPSGSRTVTWNRSLTRAGSRSRTRMPSSDRSRSSRATSWPAPPPHGRTSARTPGLARAAGAAAAGTPTRRRAAGQRWSRSPPGRSPGRPDGSGLELRGGAWGLGWQWQATLTLNRASARMEREIHAGQWHAPGRRGKFHPGMNSRDHWSGGETSLGVTTSAVSPF